jgi:hypothetical protein
MRVLFSEIAVSNPAQTMRAVSYVMLHVVFNVTVLTTLEMYRTLHMISGFRRDLEYICAPLECYVE